MSVTIFVIMGMIVGKREQESHSNHPNHDAEALQKANIFGARPLKRSMMLLFTLSVQNFKENHIKQRSGRQPLKIKTSFVSLDFVLISTSPLAFVNIILH